MYPKISIITAVYNNERHIEDALKSVLSQSYPNVELIVIDGGSKDQTMEIVKRYQSKIHTLVSEPDRGIYDALNKGLQKATGDVIGFLHSDDLFASTSVLESIAQVFQKNSVDGVYSDLNYVREVDHQFQIIRHWKSAPFTPELLQRGWMPPHPTLYLKKSVYETVGLFDLQYRIAADYDFILRTFVLSQLKFSYFPKVTVQMRIGGASNKNLKKIIQKSKEDYQILQKNGYSSVATLLMKNVSKLGQFFARSKT
jgi:glycosyltransferase involved in cell wall biosynthesis